MKKEERLLFSSGKAGTHEGIRRRAVFQRPSAISPGSTRPGGVRWQVLSPAAAVILPKDFDLLGVDDSKKLSPKKREELFLEIKERAVAYGIGLVDHAVIDRINILEATKLAMKEALREAEKGIREQLGSPWREASFVRRQDEELLHRTCPDRRAAAERCADTADRDHQRRREERFDRRRFESWPMSRETHIMMQYDELYPGYAFASNKGYGTEAHYAGLRQQGLCPIHRRSFLKDFS